MKETQRKIVLITSSEKMYIGLIDVPNENFRTTDLLNSSNVYWKNPNDKCFDKAIMMYEVMLSLDHTRLDVYKRFKRLQLKTSEVVLFFDDSVTVGDQGEKLRANAMKEKTHEQSQTVNIITPIIGKSFWDISGTFFGLFKKKSRDNFIPLNNASIFEVRHTAEGLQRTELKLPHTFVGVNARYIESLSFE